LPADDLAPTFPPGYTIVGYGGTASFDYRVTDGRHADATISRAFRWGGGTCSATTMTCTFGPLGYEWSGVGQGSVVVTPTALPAGYRFGTADANDGLDPGGAIPITVDPADHHMTVDASTVLVADVHVYLLAQPDTKAPVVSKPVTRFVTLGAIGATLPVRISWTGSDTGSGIGRYILQVSKDGHPYATLSSSLSGTWFRTSVARGHSYRYRVRAVDKAGNHSAWMYGPPTTVSLVQDASRFVVYRGTWHVISVATATGGTVHRSAVARSTARLTFTGRAVAFVAPESLASGSARVYLDGSLVATVDLHNVATARVIQYARTWARVGTHTILVKVVGTAGHPRVDVDAFAVLR
jgi:hypothetical protein